MFLLQFVRKVFYRGTEPDVACASKASFAVLRGMGGGHRKGEEGASAESMVGAERGAEVDSLFYLPAYACAKVLRFACFESFEADGSWRTLKRPNVDNLREEPHQIHISGRS